MECLGLKEWPLTFDLLQCNSVDVLNLHADYNNV